MSIDQIPTQGTPFIYQDPDGNSLVEEDWYLFLYNLWISTTAILIGGVPFPDAVNLTMVDLDVIGADVAKASGSSAKVSYPKGASWDASPTGLVVPAGASVILPAPCQAAGTILGAYALGESAAGSATVEVWKASAGVPTSANKISGSNPITLSASQSSTDLVLATWSTTAVAAGDRFGFKLLTSTVFSFLGVYLIIG